MKKAVILTMVCLGCLLVSGCCQRCTELETVIGKYSPTDSNDTIINSILLHTEAINQFRVQIDENTCKLNNFERKEE